MRGMAPPTLEPDTPNRDLIRENTHPYVNLEANPLTAGLAAPFAALQTELTASLADESQLLFNIASAEAKAVVLDRQFDDLVDALKHACLVITKGDTTILPYTTYFGKKAPAEVKEPLLDEEVDITAAWLTSLQQSPHATLQEIGTKLAPLVVVAEPAMKALADANQALLDFFEVGARFQLVAKMNSARKYAYGQLGQIVHDHPELGLSVHFPDTFFLHDTRKRKETPASIDGEIAALKKRIAALSIKREKLAAVLAAGKQADAKKKKGRRADEIAKAEKAQVEAAAKLAALKAEQDAEDAAAGQPPQAPQTPAGPQTPQGP